MSGKTSEVRSLLITVTNGHLLIPNSCVQEVITYSTPDSFDNPSQWLLGGILWQGWQVPVISFANLTGLSGPENTERARIMVVKSLLDNRRLPYLGVLVQALPKLITITPETLVEQSDQERTLGVHSHVALDDMNAIIPDLDRLAQLVAHAAYGALPITKV